MDDNMPMGETMKDGSDMPSPIMLDASMLPDGCKPGDKLVIGQADDKGMVSCTLEKGSDMENDDREKQKWEDGLREAMSPRNGGEDAE